MYSLLLGGTTLPSVPSLLLLHMGNVACHGAGMQRCCLSRCGWRRVYPGGTREAGVHQVDQARVACPGYTTAAPSPTTRVSGVPRCGLRPPCQRPPFPSLGNLLFLVNPAQRCHPSSGGILRVPRARKDKNGRRSDSRRSTAPIINLEVD